jgi:hypothetical protein
LISVCKVDRRGVEVGDVGVETDDGAGRLDEAVPPPPPPPPDQADRLNAVAARRENRLEIFISVPRHDDLGPVLEDARYR